MGYVKESGSDSLWIVEPGDVISIYRDFSSNSNLPGILDRYTITEDPNTDVDSCGKVVGNTRSHDQLDEYNGRLVMIEDWTRRRGDRLIGFIGVLKNDLRVNRKYGLVVVPYKQPQSAGPPATQETQLIAEAELVVETLDPQTSPINQIPE